MKKISITFSLATVLLFAVSAIAADKAVVIPLGSKKPVGDAVAADVLEGKTFSNQDNVGIVGTIPTQTLNADSTSVPTGYYEMTTLNAVDNDLDTSNIKNSVSIFGVTGTLKKVICENIQWCKTDGATGGCYSDQVTCLASVPPGDFGDGFCSGYDLACQQLGNVLETNP